MQDGAGTVAHENKINFMVHNSQSGALNLIMISTKKYILHTMIIITE